MKHSGCLAVLLTWGLLPSFAADRSSTAFTNAADIHPLSRDDATLGHPALIRGIVTYSDPRWNLLFVQDRTAGIFVGLSGDAYPTNGEVIEVAGSTGDGSFLPVITSASWKHLGAAPMPEPHQVGSSERFLGDIDCEWSELTGVVRRVVPDVDQRHIEIDLGGTGWRSRTYLPLPEGFNPAQWNGLVDAKIRVRGVCGLDYDDSPGGLRLKTFIPNRSCLQVLVSVPNDPFLSPLLRVEQVRSFLTTNPPMHRVRARGIATYVAGSALILQEGQSALRVQGLSNVEFKVGDSLEAVGFVTAGVFSPVLEEALIRPTSVVTSVETAPVAPATVLWGDYDGRLVALTGMLHSQKHSATNHTLVLVQDGIVFGVSLYATNAQNAWNHLNQGDRLRVTGVCSIQGSPTGAPQSFGVLLRTEGDVVRLPAVHMFSGRQVLAILGLGAAAWGLVLLWGVMLRRRVSQQTHELAHSLSLLTAAIESTADGFLVVNHDGQVTVYNQVFARMWQVPCEMIKTSEDDCLMSSMAAQVKNEDEFRGKVRQLQDEPELESFDTIELKDGRVFERYSRPQHLNGQCVGRVWGFRDITARKQAEAKLQAVHQQLLMAESVIR
ncbi:MAG TPA: PAS domain-containing protein [Verrucomicrobiae bacterium]|nr:PAS domain-containing protein [Verrucomicrobiae bacterium]